MFGVSLTLPINSNPELAMSEWIKDAIETATRERHTNQEHALLRESTYRSLFAPLEQALREQIQADVAAYNAHFQGAPTKQLTLDILSGHAGVPLTFTKAGDPPTGRVSISFDRDTRSVHASVIHMTLEGGRQVRAFQSYRLRLDGDTLIIEDEAGGSLDGPSMSRRILEPFFLGVT